MQIKAIVMDVDGTLLSTKKKEITPRTKAALLKAQERGCRLIIASGRPTPGLTDLAKELLMDKHHGLLVSFNGSKVTDCETGDVLYNQTLPIPEAQSVLEHMKKFKVRPMIDKDDYLYVNDVFDCMIQFEGTSINIIHHEARGGKYLLCEKKDLAAFADYPINKILTAGDPSYLEAHYEEMRKPFMGKLNAMFTAPFYFEFTALGVDKAKALETVLTGFGCGREQVIAFGDGQNDRTMIEYAGIGVAMENAVQELKDAADEVTLSNEEDGIAETLCKYMPELND